MFYWYLPGEEQQAKALFAEFPKTLDFFESVIGPYPFGDQKLGVVETPHKGMEPRTINEYGNAHAKTHYGFRSQARPVGNATVRTHKSRWSHTYSKQNTT